MQIKWYLQIFKHQREKRIFNYINVNLKQAISVILNVGERENHLELQ